MSKEISIRYLMEVIIRRKWCLIVPLVLCVITAGLLLRTLPKFYQSTSLILVHPSELSREFVRGMVEYDVSTDLQNIEEQFYSRNWMARVIDELKLGADLAEGEEYDAFLKRMLDRVIVDTGGRTSFTISFSGKDPQTVFTVVQSLTQMFIAESVAQTAKSDADAAFDLDEEIRTLEQELSAKEMNLAVYKQRHMGELPEQIEPNQRLLERLQVQQQLNGENLRDARNRQVILESQLMSMGESGPVGQDPLVNDLMESRQTLEDLKQQYTDNHPDVINALARVEILEGQLANRTSPEAGQGSAGGEGTLSQVNAYGLALSSELEDVKMRIQRHEGEDARLRQEIQAIEGRVEAAFSRQQELTQLTRSYENLDEYYRTLIDRKLNIRLSSKVLRTHSANQYEILDPPRVPLHPYTPDPIKIIILGLLCGLVLGAVVTTGMEFRNDAFFSADSLEESMQIPVLATIPVLGSKEGDRQNKRKMLVLFASVLMAVVALICINLFLVDLVGLLRDFLNSVIQ